MRPRLRPCAMNFLRLMLLLVLVGAVSGCASSAEVSDDPPPPEQVPTHDDTHGWGANIQGVGKQ